MRRIVAIDALKVGLARLEHFPEFRGDSEVALAAIQFKPSEINSISPVFQNNLLFMREAVRRNERVLKHLPLNLQYTVASEIIAW